MMNKLAFSVATALAALAHPAMAAPGTVDIDANLRYETVDDNNISAGKTLGDADALTLRTRLTFTSESYYGITAVVGFEDVQDLTGDYNSTDNGKTDYAVVADPDVTELDQALLMYNWRNAKFKLGRQVIAWDNQRFIGDVGWRQDRQTFDALSVEYQPLKELTLNYAFIDQRNTIFGDDKNIDTSDHILNAAYKTDYGMLKGYSYLLDYEDSDTFGASFAGAMDVSSMKVLYHAEIATQSAGDYDATYLMLEAGTAFDNISLADGGIQGLTVKIGYEMLGSDDGNYGFSTPLGTNHKFNGWADRFLATPTAGLIDMYLSVGSKVYGGALTLAYHDFSSDDDLAPGYDDLGDEVDVLYTYKFNKTFSSGLKMAMYSEGDDTSRKDVDKNMIWLSAAF